MHVMLQIFKKHTCLFFGATHSSIISSTLFLNVTSSVSLHKYTECSCYGIALEGL